MSDDTTWFWTIVDAHGLANVSSDETVALREIIARAEAAEARVTALEAEKAEREEAALAGLTSDMAREIEAHDAFDCPDGWTYVRAANEIAQRLVERFGRAQALSRSTEKNDE